MGKMSDLDVSLATKVLMGALKFLQDVDAKAQIGNVTAKAQ